MRNTVQSRADRRREQRERQRAARIQAALEAAERQEIIGEQLAPAAMRHAVRDASGHVLVGARVVIVDGRPVAAEFGSGVEADPLVALARKSRQITDAHVAAAKQLRSDWRLVGSGLGFGASDYLRSAGRGDGDGKHRAMLDQIEARGRLDGALTYVGAFAPCLARVVLDCVPLSAWAAAEKKSPSDAIAWVAAALTRLAAYYAPVVPVASKPKIRTIGPPRAAYAQLYTLQNVAGKA